MSLSVHRFSLSLYPPHHLSVKDPGLTDLQGWGAHRLDSPCHVYICTGQCIPLFFACGKLAVYGTFIRYIRLTTYVNDFWLRCQISSVGENEVCLIFEQLVLEQLSIYRDLEKKKKSSSYFTLCRKVNLRWIKGLIVIVRPQGCWKKTRRQSLCSWGEQCILRQDWSQSTEENGVKLELSKVKNFCSTKDCSQQVQRQATARERVCNIYTWQTTYIRKIQRTPINQK